MKSRWIMLCVALAGAGLSQRAIADGDIDKGRELAVTHCARCHVIGEFNKFGGIGSTPSFRLIRGLEDGMERFQTFYERRPHPVFVRVPDVPKWSDADPYVTEFTVTLEAIDDLLAYAETIEKLDLSRIPVVGGVGPSRKQQLSGSRLER